MKQVAIDALVRGNVSATALRRVCHGVVDVAGALHAADVEEGVRAAVALDRAKP